MPEETVAVEKPVRKRRKKAPPIATSKICKGSANFHICRISTGEELTIAGVKEHIVKASSELMLLLLQKAADAGLDPADVHLAFELDLDTDDHPGEKTEPEMPARVM